MGPEDIPGVELPMHQPYAGKLSDITPPPATMPEQVGKRLTRTFTIDKFGLVGFDELAQNWPEKFGQRKAGDHWGILKCVNDK